MNRLQCPPPHQRMGTMTFMLRLVGQRSSCGAAPGVAVLAVWEKLTTHDVCRIQDNGVDVRVWPNAQM